MEKQLIITTEEAYQETMITIFEMMERGENDLTDDDKEQLRIMAAAVEKYEDDYL